MINRFPQSIAALVLFFLAFYTTAQAQKRYFPAYNNWETKSPNSLGINASKLQEAIDFAIENETNAPRDQEQNHYTLGFGKEPYGYGVGPFKERGPATGLIIKNGYIVAQWGDPASVDMTHSVTKTFLSSTVGLAYDQGMIRLEGLVYKDMAPVVPYEPYNMGRNRSEGWGSPHVLSLWDTEHNQKITWDHLLRQTSDWEGTLWGKPDWADRPDRQNPGAWTTRPRNEPGSFYKYNDVRVNLLALAILNIWRKPLPEVLKNQMMDKIGASKTWRWHGYENSWVILDGVPMQSVSGGGHWGGGMFINAYDQARLGYLTLNEGHWNGDQILSKEWIEHATTPTEVKKTYGFMNYFLNTDQALYPSAPASAFAHLGAGTNFVYVDRANDLVIVARWIDRGALDGLISRVLESLK